jgi:hypothetical protein
METPQFYTCIVKIRKLNEGKINNNEIDMNVRQIIINYLGLLIKNCVHDHIRRISKASVMQLDGLSTA